MRKTCVLTIAIAGLSTTPALAQLNILSVNEQIQAHSWIVASAPAGGTTTDGGLNTDANTLTGPWNSSVSSVPAPFNNSSATQQSLVSPTAISAIGSISITRVQLTSMTDVYHSTFSRFTVQFEVLAPTLVDFDAAVDNSPTGANQVMLSRISPDPTVITFAANPANRPTASYDGILTPGIYSIYADAPYPSGSNIRPSNPSPQTFGGGFSTSLIVVPAPAAPVLGLLGLAALARRRR